jgi:hypothetical protein
LRDVDSCTGSGHGRLSRWSCGVVHRRATSSNSDDHHRTCSQASQQSSCCDLTKRSARIHVRRAPMMRCRGNQAFCAVAASSQATIVRPAAGRPSCRHLPPRCRAPGDARLRNGFGRLRFTCWCRTANPRRIGEAKGKAGHNHLAALTCLDWSAHARVMS